MNSYRFVAMLALQLVSACSSDARDDRSRTNTDTDAFDVSEEQSSALAESLPPPTLVESYGSRPGQEIHLWHPDGSRPRSEWASRPVVFFVHGGGWVGGDAVNNGLLRQIHQPLLRAGIAVASAEYRHLGDFDHLDQPARGTLADIRRALQYLRHRSGAWGVDSNRVAGAGNSAGGCAILYLALHADMAVESADPVTSESTRLAVVAVAGAQTTLDPAVMSARIPTIDYGHQAFGFRAFESFRRARDADPSLRRVINNYSPAALVDTNDDPAIYMSYRYEPSDLRDPTHASAFGVLLSERLLDHGIDHQLVYPGRAGRSDSLQVFLIDMLSR